MEREISALIKGLSQISLPAPIIIKIIEQFKKICRCGSNFITCTYPECESITQKCGNSSSYFPACKKCNRPFCDSCSKKQAVCEFCHKNSAWGICDKCDKPFKSEYDITQISCGFCRKYICGDCSNTYNIHFDNYGCSDCR